MTFSKILCLAALARFSTAGYVLQDDYSPSNFFSMFDFFTDADPTHGFVKYVSQNTAQGSQLISTTTDSVYIGVDHQNVQPSGRPSVRLSSTKSYNEGLVILDLDHMPGGACGTWPAFWMLGDNWPNNGEIDIIEGVNEQTENAMTLHTGPNCAISSTGSFSGTVATSNCYVQAADQSANAGCSIGSSAQNSYGRGFNAASGGVYATLWTSSYISVFYFPRGAIPADVTSGSPNPYSWGMPQANFSGACDIPSSFKNLKIVFDTTFCGDWAGAVWSTGSCASKAKTCEDYVANNPSAFSDAYWSIKSLKVYQESAGSGSPSPSTTPSFPPATTSYAGQPVAAAVSSASTSAAVESEDAPFPAGNTTSTPLATGTGAPFPAGNSSSILPTGSGSPANFVTVTVTQFVTVTPTPESTGSASELAQVKAVDSGTAQATSTAPSVKVAKIERPAWYHGNWKGTETFNSDRRRHFKHMVGVEKRHRAGKAE